MVLVFRLSMPGVNSWNGRWSGEHKVYAIVKSFGRTTLQKGLAQEILNRKHFTHRFGDGWVAVVTVEQVDKAEAAKIKKRSDGFCGYNWMVDSIIENLEIKI